jgi:hypothetical protein
MISKEETLRKRVINLKNLTVNHFIAEGVSRSTLFEILKRSADGIYSEMTQ